jgi:hypothetical protein
VHLRSGPRLVHLAHRRARFSFLIPRRSSEQNDQMSDFLPRQAAPSEFVVRLAREMLQSLMPFRFGWSGRAEWQFPIGPEDMPGWVTLRRAEQRGKRKRGANIDSIGKAWLAEDAESSESPVLYPSLHVSEFSFKRKTFEYFRSIFFFSRHWRGDSRLHKQGLSNF